MTVLFWVCTIGILSLFLIWRNHSDQKKAKERFRDLKKTQYGASPNRNSGEEALSHVSHFFEDHRQENAIDDITWNDLEMDSVFARLNYCESAAGEEVLYDFLRNPCRLNASERARLERQIELLQTDGDVRLQLQYQFYMLRQRGKFSIYDYLHLLDQEKKRRNGKHFLLLFLLILSLVCCIFSVSGAPLFLVGMICVNMITYFQEKGRSDAYLSVFYYVLRLLGEAEKLERIHHERLQETFDLELQELHQAIQSLSAFRRGSSILMSSARMSGSGNPLDLLVDYLRILTHIDLIKCNQMFSELKEHREDVDCLHEKIGRMEVPLSIACFRASLKEGWSIPRWEDGGELTITGAYHPLLQHPVKNSIRCQKNILITGSNASGKSTFLKTIALCSLLAQTIQTVPAESYCAPIFRIFSSMTLRDDLEGGDSYYMVEIKALKRVIDESKKGGNKVLCFVDEVLRGTNTVERIAASTEILRYFSQENVLCFAATHDIELTGMLNDVYDYYYFEGDITENDIHFHYHLQAGVAKTRNAIQLLKLMGYETEIVERAETMAQRFLKEGVWRE